MTEPFSKRRRVLNEALVRQKLGALVVTHPPDWYYLTGFTGEAGALVLGQNWATLITDGRFIMQGREETRSVEIVQYKAGLFQAVGELLKGLKMQRAGFDPSQLNVAQHQELRKVTGPRCKLKPVSGLVLALRTRKEPQELAQMHQAAILASEVVQHAIGLLKPGVRELEIAAEIEYQMRKRGASGPAFESIVAFGERTALPHARPTSKQLRKNEFVVLDLGAILGHYCSDITRTVFVGRASARIRRWHRAVQEARSAAVAAVRAGVSCGEVDATARRVLAGHRLERYFVHSTGHGLGLEVHEEPRVARGQKQQLVPGNVITIEPGVYIPDIGGIRIEDDVAVLAGGAQILTSAPRELIEI